jgi:hypothetical protein
MTTTYAGTTPTSYPATTRVLVGSDEQLAANYNACYQDLRDASNFLNAERVRIVNQVPGLANGVQWIDLQSGLPEVDGSWTRATQPASGRPYWKHKAMNEAVLWFDATPWLPRTGLIVLVAMWVTGTPHETELPGTLPKLILQRVARSGSAVTEPEVLVEYEDPSTYEQYRVHHIVSAELPTPHEIDTEYVYMIGMRGPAIEEPPEWVNFLVDGLQITLGAAT